MTSCACLVGSGLKEIFHLKAHSDTFWRSELRLLVEMFILETTEKIDVSSAKNFTFGVIPSNHQCKSKIEEGPKLSPEETQL